MAESTIILHEPALRDLLDRPTGPTGRFIERRTLSVLNRALLGAAGRPGPEIRSGDLLRNTNHVSVRPVGGELQGDVSSDARHRGFSYPIALELGGVTPTGGYYRYPFLEPALAEEFNQPYQP